MCLCCGEAKGGIPRQRARLVHQVDVDLRGPLGLLVYQDYLGPLGNQVNRDCVWMDPRDSEVVMDHKETQVS